MNKRNQEKESPTREDGERTAGNSSGAGEPPIHRDSPPHLLLPSPDSNLLAELDRAKRDRIAMGREIERLRSDRNRAISTLDLIKQGGLKECGCQNTARRFLDSLCDSDG